MSVNNKHQHHFAFQQAGALIQPLTAGRAARLLNSAVLLRAVVPFPANGMVMLGPSLGVASHWPTKLPNRLAALVGVVIAGVVVAGPLDAATEGVQSTQAAPASNHRDSQISVGFLNASLDQVACRYQASQAY